jgi:hypothetical protein
VSEPNSVATQVLEAWGAKVISLPASSQEGCDLFAEMDGVRLLVEEKTKFDDPAAVLARSEALASGSVHGSTLPLRGNNRISGIVRKASKQLSSTGAQMPHDLRVVWFTGVGFDAQAKHFQFISTLYGSTRIFEIERPGMRECYFFRNSDFYRYRDHLDGAVAAYVEGQTVTVKLCLNPYAEAWEALRDSPYARRFKVGLIDPVAEEAAGHAYIADSDMPRTDDASILRFLEQKYGLKMANNMDMNLASAVVRVPREG